MRTPYVEPPAGVAPEIRAVGWISDGAGPGGTRRRAVAAAPRIARLAPAGHDAAADTSYGLRWDRSGTNLAHAAKA